MDIQRRFPSCYHRGCSLESPFELLKGYTGRDISYASRGRWALYHTIRSLSNTPRAILVPAYICPTILIPLYKLGIDFEFYDSELKDCNLSLSSFEQQVRVIEPDFVLLASMYGNALDYSEALRICNDHGVKVIDDAAQSFGATYFGKPVGTFGDAGFISLSPAKPISYSLGAYYWTSNINYSPKLVKRQLIHDLLFLEYFFTRVRPKSSIVSHLLKTIRSVYKLFDFSKNDISKKELNDHAMEIYSYLQSDLYENRESVKLMSKIFEKNFNIVSKSSVSSAPSKFVLQSDDASEIGELKMFLGSKGVFSQYGYDSLVKGRGFSAEVIGKHILEIPLAKSNKELSYLDSAIREFYG